MARALILLAFATCLGCAVAANGSNVSSIIAPTTSFALSSSLAPNSTNATSSTAALNSTTPTPTPSSTAALNSTTPTPTPTPTPSPYPTPTPILPEEKWNLTDSKNKTCILMEAKIQLVVTFPSYQNRSDNGSKVVDRKLILDVDGVVDTTSPYKSNCQVAINMSLLTVKFDHGSTYHLSFTFKQLNDSTWNMSRVDFLFPIANNPDFDGLVNISNYTDSGEAFLAETLYRSDHDMSYVCNANENKTLDTPEMDDSFKIKMITSDLQVQAFSFKKNGQFDTAKECSADKKHKGGSSDNKIVPIAVGAALAGLVIIVLIAYLIGRFRSRKHKSYETLS